LRDDSDGGGLEERRADTVDGGEPKYIDKWAPTWLSGWTAGKHTIKLELDFTMTKEAKK